jgi:hypothetical protein
MINTTIRPNRYAADCAKGCGTRVQPGQGALVKPNGRWGAEHLQGECPTPGTPNVAPVQPHQGENLADGCYAVERAGTLYFYRVVTKSEGRWAGRQFVNRFKSDDLLPITRRESEEARALILADVEAARATFARELTRCYQCGKMLTDDLSRALGIGPVCRAGGRD